MTQLPGGLPRPLDLSKRKTLRRATFAGLLASGGFMALAGGQLEEPLADAVRSALGAAVADQAPPVLVFSDAQRQSSYQRWLEIIDLRLQRRMPESQTRQAFLQTLWYESTRARLDPALVLGLIQVESAFRKFAVSAVGARGYMQVMPFWARLIGDGEVSRLFQVQTNLRFGCVILRHYLDLERGDVFMGLGRYNGSRGQRPYPDAVLAAQQGWLV